MSRDSFVFKKSWRDVICGLAIQVRMSLYEAIINYGLTGELTELKGQARATFDFIKQDIDSMNSEDEERRQHIAEVRRKAGLKSGESRRQRTKRTNVQFVQSLENPPSPPENPPSPSRTCVIGNQENIDDDKNNNSKKKKENGEKKDKEDLTWFTQTGWEGGPKNIKLANEQCQSIVFCYNHEIDSSGSMMPKCRTLTNKRKAFIMARIKEYGIPTVEEVISKACRSNFLGGDNNRGWRADFEWIMRPNNFPKILDGNYDNFINKKTNGENQKQYDPRRGCPATHHSDDEN